MVDGGRFALKLSGVSREWPKEKFEAIIHHLPGVDFSEFNSEDYSAMIFFDPSKNDLDEIIVSLLESGVKFSRFQLLE